MSKKDPRLTPKQIEKLLNNPKKLEIEEPQVVKQLNQKLSFKGCNKDYDTLNAVEQIKLFCTFIKDLIAHYEENERLQTEAETMEMDIKHAIELVEKLTEKEKKQLYSKLTDVLQTRRACKSENEILQPLYNYFNDKVLLNKLIQLQGIVQTTKEIISNRAYACRTDVLNDFRTTADN